jgi:hypothetical protein
MSHIGDVSYTRHLAKPWMASIMVGWILYLWSRDAIRRGNF